MLQAAAGDEPAGEGRLGTGRAQEPVRKGGGEGARRAGRVTQQPTLAHRNSSSAPARHDAERVRPGCRGRQAARVLSPLALEAAQRRRGKDGRLF